MIETLSHLALQQYWWFIISVLGALLVFLMFVQGGQTLIYSLGKTELERTMLINALGRKWEFTFTTLVTFGGAFFASFPLFYSTSFGGAYWVWMIILFAFIIQAVSYEFRSKPNNFFGAKTYEVFLIVNGLIGTIFLGTAVATFFSGSAFSVNDLNQSKWELSSHGLEAVLNPFNVILGLAVFFLARVLGLLYFRNSIADESIHRNIQKQLPYNALPFVVLFVAFAAWLLLRDGYAVDATTGTVSLQPYKYFINLVEMPLVGILFVAGVLLVLAGIAISFFKPAFSGGIWYAGSGTVLTVLSLFLIAGWNNTAYYPSSHDLQSSLTIINSSSSHFTLKVMAYVSMLIPFVLGYIILTWRAMNKKDITRDEMDSNEIHIY